MTTKKSKSSIVADSESFDRVFEKPVSSLLQCFPSAGLQYSTLKEFGERKQRLESSKNDSSCKSMALPIEREQSIVEGFDVEMTEESFFNERFEASRRSGMQIEEDRSWDDEFAIEMRDESVCDEASMRDEPVPENTVATKGMKAEDEDELNGFWQRQAKAMARRPRTYFWSALLGAVTIGVVGMVFGEFSVEPDNAGWTSRGTTIADRTSQVFLVRGNRGKLFSRDEDAWDDLINNVQPGWETSGFDDSSPDDDRRFLMDSSIDSPLLSPRFGDEGFGPESTLLTNTIREKQLVLPFEMTDEMKRRLQDASFSNLLEGCDLNWYDASNATQENYLWSMWKTQKSSDTALDPMLLRDICFTEEKTQAHLVKEGLCITCDGGGCLPPYGLVFFARLSVPNGFSMSCSELSEAWAEYQSPIETQLATCVEDVKHAFDPDAAPESLPASCPFGFYPSLVDELYDSTVRVAYSASVFATVDDPVALFEKVSGYDRGTELIKGAYDTNFEDFVNQQIELSLYSDMLLAIGSGVVTSLAILVHTRSPYLTLIGLLQILLSVPIAYFVYVFIAQLDFFPVLNFIGVFVVFALGADDVFVAVDKWKNARLEHWDKSTEYIAAKALPDAAGAMFLTTLTTAVAFFGTAVCPVAPVLCFAVYCGLLIIFDYLLCILLVFPALCIYDEKKDVRNICFNCHVCRQLEAKGPHGEEDDEKPSLIRRILLVLYNFIHRFRWVMMVIILAGFGVSTYYATKLGLPETSDVRLLSADDFQYELHYEWRFNLLYEVLARQAGSSTSVVFGSKPADTGDHLNPYTFSQLVLDETFDPSNEDVQVYLQGFCDDLFAQDFAEKTDPDYVCAMNQFDAWLQEQSQLDLPDEAYTEFCGEATGLPVRQSNFDACIIGWSEQFRFKPILARGDVVKIIYVQFNSRIRFDSPHDIIDKEWNLIENWMKNQADNVAPKEVGDFYFSSVDFWWYDTNGQMLSTTYVAAAIALVTAGIVILFSSHSVTLTLFAVFTIGFILVATTACLVGLGWSLGFLEAICFAILIGISCDFVIHFAHAYAALPGMHSRDERTKHALILMGPSILAAAFTTIAAAIIMLFTVITFFEKFAYILFFTVVLSTVGAFIVFITLTDCIGPTHPTFLVDLMVSKCRKCRKNCKKKKETAAAFKEMSEDESTSEDEKEEEGSLAEI